MRKTILSLMVSLCLFVACNDDGTTVSPENKTGQSEERIEKGSLRGVVRIKFSEELINSVDPVPTRNGIISTGISQLDDVIHQLGITNMKRTFPHGGKYEERQKKAGLHRWYDVIFDENASTTRAISNLETVTGIEIVEPVYKIKRIDSDMKPIPLTQELIRSLEVRNSPTSFTGLNFFNDEHLLYQWHYNNEGSAFVDGFRPGADINLFPAWKIETGKPEVIVAIIDGGIQYNHPDLAANMWINEAEMSGVPGQDDDNNGYKDDIYGYNFVTNKGQINAHDHGTHVAGTVAAVNNNGVGVSGVAGGDGTPGSGIRLMSCQIFDTMASAGTEQSGAAIVYAANNGAVIAQNSWGYEWDGIDQDIQAAHKEAIDYFIKYAGTNGDGVTQVGPMKGGIVIFAAGNANTSGLSMPSAYEKVLSVSSVGPDNSKASYSNYGPWTDISAPGGEKEFGTYGLVLSTTPGDDYGFMEGTSMACPHVSGVAALVVSKYGKEGFTCEELWNRLLNGTNDITRFTPDHAMGIGYINAQKALSDNGRIAPDRVNDLTGEELTFERATLSWSITADSDNGKPERYEVLWGEEELWNIDLSNLPQGTKKSLVRVSESQRVGDKTGITINSLELGKTYYFAVVGVDRDGNVSPSTTIYGTTEENKAPVVEGIPANTSLKRTESRTVTLRVYDPEGYKWTYTLDGGSSAVTASREGNDIHLYFDALAGVPGSFTAVLTVTDEQGISRSENIPYSIQPNNLPVVVKDIEQVIFYNTGISQRINLNDYIKDADDDELTFVIGAENSSIVTFREENGILELISNGFGSTTITITVYDPTNEKVTTSFHVICRNPEQKVDLYPTPVRKDGILNIRMGEDVEGIINVALYNAYGSKVFDEYVKIAPNAPAAINIASLSGGNYKVVVKHINKEYTQTITKL